MTEPVNSDFSRIFHGLGECDIIKIQVVVFQYNLNFVKRKHTHFSVIHDLKIGDKIHLKCSNVLIVLFPGGSIMGDLYFLIVHFLHS